MIGFPCNQFQSQEPFSNADIKSSMRKKYNVTFQLMDKCDVNGPRTHDVFKYLRGNSRELQSRKDPTKMLQIPWNFCKWILDENGKIHMYLNPTVSLFNTYDLIEHLLGGQPSKAAPLIS